MGLRTAEQYKQSMRDGRRIFIEGEKVDDVTAHPLLKGGVELTSVAYLMQEMAEYKEMAVVTDEQTGEPMSRYYLTAREAEDLLKRHELYLESIKLSKGQQSGGYLKVVGSDAMNAVMVTASAMGNKEYSERARQFLAYLQRNDLTMAGAMTDVKGDRRLRPSDSRQTHPDYYVRVVDRNKDGIIVKGAKVHITAAPGCNEFMVMPCRGMTESDADYAVSFAIQPNAKGVTQVAHPVKDQYTSSEFPVDLPVRSHTDSLIIFDDVFVPWKRVFLCGEWQFAGTLVYNFAYLHRFTACTHTLPRLELLLGMAQAMAEYNGIESVPHVREHITDLAIYVSTLKFQARAACLDYVTHGGIAIPNPMLTNIAKYHYASNYHSMVKRIEDIAGGLLITAPTYRDWQNPETRNFLDKYLGGKAGMPTEDRLRMLQLMRQILGLEQDIKKLHAEGSMMAQRRTIYQESTRYIEECKQEAKVRAGIEKATKGSLITFIHTTSFRELFWRHPI